MKRAIFLICFSFILLFSGCAAKYDIHLDFDPTEPLRVAVLPFYEVDHKGTVINSDQVLFQTANLNYTPTTSEIVPSTIVQRMVQAELEESQLDVIPQSIVQADFVHHGYTAGLSYDYDKIKSTSAKAICDLLICDAVLRGKLTRWSQNYYAIQSVSSVGLELVLERASDGAVLYSAIAEDSDSRGLTKVPTGFTSLSTLR